MGAPRERGRYGSKVETRCPRFFKNCDDAIQWMNMLCEYPILCVAVVCGCASCLVGLNL